MVASTEPRDPVLFEAWRNYISAACAALQPHVQDFELDDLVRESVHWAPTSHDRAALWQRCRMPRLNVWPLIFRHKQTLLRLPEYSDCLRALRSNPVVSSHVGAHVGTALEDWLVQEDEFVDQPLDEMVTRTGSVKFEAAFFIESYRHIEEALYSESFQYKMIAPIQRARFEALPIRLSDTLEIVEMTLEETSQVLETGLLSPMAPRDGWETMRDRPAIRYTYSLPKRIWPADPTDSGDDHSDREMLEVLEELRLLPEEVLRSLRLVHRRALLIPGAVNVRLSWWGRHDEPRTDVFPMRPHDSLATAFFSEARCQDIAYFYRELRSRRVTRHRGILQSVRRFSYAMESHRDEDALVDLVIAAEALFLMDTTAPKERGELRYRLSLRAAYFLGGDVDERRRIFRFMKLAYDARSAIAHGGDPPKLKDPEGNDVALRVFRQHVAHYVRRALQKAVREAPSRGAFVNWEDDLILGGAGGELPADR